MVLAIATLWLIVGLPYGSYRLRAARHAWADGFLSEPDFEARYAAHDSDATARRLDEAARRMGTSFIYLDEDSGAPDTLKRARDYMMALRKETDGPVRVPSDVARLVEERAESLAAVEAQLAENPSVSWKFGTGSGMLSLLGVRNVNTLLVLRALLAEQGNSPADRERSLEASWRLSESVRRGPLLIDRLIMVVTVSDRNAGLRRLKAPSKAWVERLRAPGRFAEIGEAYQGESHLYSHAAEARLLGVADLDFLEGGDLPSTSPARWVVRLLSAPFVRLNVAGYSDTLRAGAARLRQANPCALDPDEFVDGIMAKSPPWNILSKVGAPPALRSWISFRDSILESELTAAVMEARSAPTGSWPSGVCPGVQWVIERKSSGVRVVAQGAPLPTPRDGWPPLAYALSPR